jgi:outer membrane receptor for ferrienterochelin and colicins
MRKLGLLVMATLAGPGAAAQETAPQKAPAQVVVTGSDSDTRTEFVAGKIIIGRTRIDASGLRTVEELLKREPAVSISGDGRIGLLNMPGYTQVLVDGRAPQGAKSTELELGLVERIEIVKSGMAEYGPFGIAGTINIVTRKIARKTSTSVKLEAQAGARQGPGLTLSHHASAAPGSPLSYSVNLGMSKFESREHGSSVLWRSMPGQPAQRLWQASEQGRSRDPAFDFSANLGWQRGDETVTLAPTLWRLRGTSVRDQARRGSDGSRLDVHEDGRSSLDLLKLPLSWSFKPGKTSFVDLTLVPVATRAGAANLRSDTSAAQSRTVRSTDSQIERWHLRGELNYKVKLSGGHNLKAGGSASRGKQDVEYAYLLDGVPDPALAALGTQRRAFEGERRLYLQDEWKISKTLALNAGIAGAQTRFDISEGPYHAALRFQSWSPSLHLSHKVGDEDQHQLRASLARSFTTPYSDAYTLRPQINPLAPCAADGVCGANTIDTADSVGNPALRPERALGLNLAYEHALADDSTLTLELFTRRIDNKMGTGLALETVAWSPTPRYVTRSANLGQAWTAGINLDWDLAVRDLAEEAPKIVVRGSVGLARSRVASLPGPDSRLDKQAPWTAKLGASYDVETLPLKLNLDASWSPFVWTRSSLLQRTARARRAALETNAIWALNKNARLVVNINQRFPRSLQTINEYQQGEGQLSLFASSTKRSTCSVTFETTL